MLLSLNELMVLKSRLEKEMKQLFKQRENTALITMSPDEDFRDYIVTTVDNLTANISQYYEALIVINDALTRANVDCKVEYKDRTYSLANLLYKVKLNRQEVAKLEYYGRQQPRMREASYSNYGNLVIVATYDITNYANRAKELDLENEEMSRIIDEANQSYKVTIDETIIPK